MLKNLLIPIILAALSRVGASLGNTQARVARTVTMVKTGTTGARPEMRAGCLGDFAPSAFYC
jgi:hypothetical protein